MKDFSIPIVIEEWAGLDRINDPVRIGVPFPRGILSDASQLGLKDAQGDLIPLQILSMAHWPDRTVKWALIDFFASISRNCRSTYTIVAESNSTRLKSDVFPKLTLKEQKNFFKIDSVAAKFTVHRQNSVFLDSIQLGGAEILSGKGGQIQLLDCKGRNYIAAIDKFILEEFGPLRCTLRAEGRFVPSRKKTFCNFITRLTFFAGTSLVQMEFQIHNPRAAIHPGGLWDLGDPGSIYFRDLSLHFALQADHDQTTINYQLYEDPVPMDYHIDLDNDEQTFSNHPMNPNNSINFSNLVIYQDSSGGENWNSRNHVNRKNEIKNLFRGFRIYSDEKMIGEGLRANPLISLKNGNKYLFGAVQDFWQNFPKSIEANENILTIRLFPKHYNDVFELQGGEKKRNTIFLDFGNSSNRSLIPNMQKPLLVLPAPEWVEKTQAIPYFVPQKDDPNNIYNEYVNYVIEGPNSFPNKVEFIDEYGWRNFGEIYADHEAVNNKGPGKLISHYNNQYDFIYGALVHFLRSGDRRWYELMRQAARHVIDIDIYHTGEDKSAYNHGLFWHTDHYRDAGTSTHRTYSRKTLDASSLDNYGGGPSNEHNYTTGLLHYYYLSGDPEARDAVLELADWVLDMDDGSKTILGIAGEGPTGLASKSVSIDYHKPGRGAGNSINSLMDAYVLSNNRIYLTKAEELVQRCIHPEDNIEALNLNDPEYRWSYLVFLQAAGKYLDLKIELKELDYYFYYARDSLLRYAGWMAKNEVAYKEVLNKVKIPTETWPATDVRKSCVFNLASKYCQSEEKEKYKERAQFFFNRCLSDLLSFQTAYLTRPLVILTVNGFMHAYFLKHNDFDVTYSQHNHDFGNPLIFQPQKDRMKTTLKTKLYEMVKFFKRQITEKSYAFLDRFQTKS